jgi:phosphoribosyl 1,2-cyclic phosphodiesterase
VRICSIGSGSKGNGTLIQTEQGCLLIDCGFGLKDCIERLAKKGIKLEEIDGVLVTHENGDHGKGVGMLARKADIPIFLSAGTFQALLARSVLREDDNIRILSPEKPIKLIGLEILPIPVPHDARETFQFIIKSLNAYFGLLTDTGSITPHLIENYAECDFLFLEFNHDTAMLWSGEYPESLKYRVGGSLGHLSNDQALNFLEAIGVQRLKKLVVSHVSEKNNDIELVDGLIREMITDDDCLMYSNQSDGCQWIDTNTYFE